MEETTYKIWYWRFEEDAGMYDYGRRLKEYVRYGNAVNAAKKMFADTDYKWLVSQTCPWETFSELCKKVAKDLPNRMDCENCFHYEACCSADTEEYMLDGEFPEECEHFIDKKYVQINEPLMTVDSFLAWVRAGHKQITQRLVYEECLKSDDVVLDENGKPLVQKREKDIKIPEINIPPLKINMDVDISKEMKMLNIEEEDR